MKYGDVEKPYLDDKRSPGISSACVRVSFRREKHVPISDRHYFSYLIVEFNVKCPIDNYFIYFYDHFITIHAFILPSSLNKAIVV